MKIPNVKLLLGISVGAVMIYFSGYYNGKAGERAESADKNTIAIQASKDETLKEQKAKDNIAAAWFKTSNEMLEKTNALQNELDKIIVDNSSSFNDRLRIINQASDCPTLRGFNDKPSVIRTSNGLQKYTVGLARDRCAIAEQLDALILSVD